MPLRVCIRRQLCGTSLSRKAMRDLVQLSRGMRKKKDTGTVLLSPLAWQSESVLRTFSSTYVQYQHYICNMNVKARLEKKEMGL